MNLKRNNVQRFRSFFRANLFAVPALAAALCCASPPAVAAEVDMAFDPVAVTVIEGDIVEVNLIVSSNGASSQPFDALDAIIEWDPAYLELLGFDQSNAGASFFIADFLPDPDGINLDLTDGEALFTALAQPGNPVLAPPAPGSLIVTTFLFQALTPVDSTIISFDRSSGIFGQTRVLLNGGTITGDISGTADVEILCDTGCPDFDDDGDVDFDDFSFLLASWGDCPKGDPCPADTDCDGDVDFDDFTFLLANYGPCE